MFLKQRRTKKSGPREESRLSKGIPKSDVSDDCPPNWVVKWEEKTRTGEWRSCERLYHSMSLVTNARLRAEHHECKRSMHAIKLEARSPRPRGE